MIISPISFRPYVYNVNSVSSASMNKVQPLANEPAKSSTDFSAMSTGNQNPLKMGESKNFMDILSSQMQMSRSNAARIMGTSEPAQANPTDNMANMMNQMLANAL